jgi:hypothetical protein
MHGLDTRIERMKYQLSSEDHLFRKQFEAGLITPCNFNHRAHLRLAYSYLCNDDIEISQQNMCRAIQAFLANYCIDPSKYHETLTRAWILAVQHFMNNAQPALSADDFISHHPRLLDTDIMLTHYSKAVLKSERARLQFVEPDLESLLTINKLFAREH